jgi:hypothetical protein
MNQIVCDYCGARYPVSEDDEKPAICASCNSPLTPPTGRSYTSPQDSAADTGGCGADGLVLIYQRTGEAIRLQNFKRIVLGRENHGMEVLGKILQISRTHCSIERKGGQYLLSDLGSMHGTYLGIGKTDCKTNPNQVLHDNDLIFMGKELFLVKWIAPPRPDGIPDEPKTAAAESGTRKVIRYRCRECGAVFDERFQKCPNDGSYGTMESIEN